MHSDSKKRRSFYPRLLALKRVTSNRGKKTPGMDGVLWQGAGAKWRAASSLRLRGYRPEPLNSIYIPKKNGKKRPLSIPTMNDRAMQALYKLALAPVAETMADKGFKVYTVLRTSAIGIRRYVKIKADANPYLPEYAAYYWRRREYKESKLLPAMSAREYRAMAT